MAYGLAPKLTLELDTEDGAYKLLKTVPEVAKQNLKMLVLTSPGERVMIPDFGVGLRRYLFELAGTGIEERIRQRIVDQVAKYLPYIRLGAVSVQTSQTSPDVPDNTLAVRIEYSVPSTSASGQTLDVKVS
jgi:phage baseplate assembly protein W